MKDKTLVTKHSIYYAWEADKEERDLDEASRNGLQLIHGGCFHSKFRKDNGVCYRYRLDYRLKIPDMMDYRATFEEQGWEYINSTFNGWHYFRKLYDPSLPESAYQIYTDKQSYVKMQNRWITLITIAGLICLVGGLYNIWLGATFPSRPNLIVGIVDTLLALFIVPGALTAKRKQQGKKSAWHLPANIFFPMLLAVLILIIGGFLFTNNIASNHQNSFDKIYKESCAFEITQDNDTPDLGGTFTVDQTGWYSVTFAMDSGGVEVTFTLADESGDLFTDIICSDYCNSSSSIRLEKGVIYTVNYDFDTHDLDNAQQIIIMTSVFG